MTSIYLKPALRGLLRNKTSSVVSIAGLAVGMLCCILILVHIKDELSFNTFNTRFNDIYRVNWITRDDGTTSAGAVTPIPFSNGLTGKIPAIENLVKLYRRTGEMESGKATAVSKRFQEQGVYFADQDMFKIFSIPFISGDKGKALSAPAQVVLTDEMARKYFGVINPVGLSLFYDNSVLLKVTGVVKKMPDNSDLKFDFLVTFETLYQAETPVFADFIKNDWTFNACETWLLLRPGTKPANIQEALNRHLVQNGSDRNRKMNAIALQPLRDIHLHASSVGGNSSKSDIVYIYVFAATAFLILVIAVVNFINLVIARSISRIKDIGMRKVLGAGKKQLAAQFMAEALLISFIAFVLALSCTNFILPVLNQLTDKRLSFISWFTPSNILIFCVVFFMTGFLAGAYPAFFITRFKMTLALKGKTGDLSKKDRIQKTLMVAQFSISIALIICTMIIYQQVGFLRDKPLGFQKHQMIIVPMYGTGAFSFGLKMDTGMRHRMNNFSDELTTYSRIKAVTASSEMPGQGFVRGLVIPQGNYETDNIFAPWLSVDYNFIRTLGMQVVAGRDFSKARGSDHLNAFILNESAVRAFGWKTPGNAIGKTFVRGKMSDGKKGQIIGVIKDFDFNSLNNPMQPLVIDVNPPRFTTFAINIQGDHINETIHHIKQVWDKIYPERVFEYSFLDKDIDVQYKDKESFSRIIGYFAVAAILLSCSGLFSLSFFLVVKRTREIGIRKVLGAGIPAILYLLSVDFIRLVLLSIVIASPVAWWLMHIWLQDFAYHVPIAWWIFAIAAFSAILIAFITVSFQSIKAALVNPVKSLQSE